MILTRRAPMLKMAAVLVFTAAFPLVVFGGSSGDELYLDAMEAYNKKQYDKSEVLLKDFMEKYPDSRFKPDVMMKLAELEESYEKSINIYKEVMGKYSETRHEAEAVYSLGRLYFAGGDYESAEEQFGKILGEFSDTVWIEMSYYSLMLSLLAQDKFDSVKRIYDDYMSREHFTIFRNRVRLVYGDSLYKQGRYLAAAHTYKDILDNFTEKEKYIYLPDVYVKLIDSYSNLSNTELAGRYSKELSEKFPKYKPDKPLKKEKDDIKIVQQEKKAVEKKKQEKKEFYTMQIGAFSTEKFSRQMQKRMEDKGYDVYVKKGRKFYKVQIGRFDTKKEAVSFAKNFSKKEKIKNYLVKKGYY